MFFESLDNPKIKLALAHLVSIATALCKNYQYKLTLQNMNGIQMSNKFIILVLFLSLALISKPQQCISSSYQRCLCTSSTPYCTCSALTPSNSLNFSSSYYSHLILVSSQGCKPCPSSCLRCLNLTTCIQCLPAFELVSGGQCQPCPANCQTCSNGICSICIAGYYIDYQTNCQVCPIVGALICTISSLQSCLSNYWLDNNAANCVLCDPNCFQCSSTTKCITCNQGYYLLSNYTCSQCKDQCLICSDSNSCSICANQNLYFNGTLGLCISGTSSNCLVFASSVKCLQCYPGYYLNSSQCLQAENLIENCVVYGNINGSIYCKNCSIGYFNSTTGCHYGCSILCSSCQGPHYGLCYACVSTASLLNMHCLPTYNLMQGASYQLFYTAFNNPKFFNSTLILSNGCIFQTISSSDTGKITISLSNLQSYEITLKWKIYLYNLPINTESVSYQAIFTNLMQTTIFRYNATYCFNCNGSSICISKASLDIASIILNSNTLIFTVLNASLGVSEALVMANRCGGIQGNSCLECSSTSSCTKCVNPNYFISGYTCVITCPSNYYVRTATKTCLSQCISGTYSNNVQLLCVECTSPCLTCLNNISCLTCINSTYLYQSTCLHECPREYFPNSMRRTCDDCIRPCLTCLSNIKCLSCSYGFYWNYTNSCVLKCQTGYYGSLHTLNCQKCIQPCQTCNSNIGSKCLSCVNGSYLYSFTCLVKCPFGYFQSGSYCQICHSSCNTCRQSALNCTSCPLQTYLFHSDCISSCPQLYYADSTLNLCVSCPSQCSSCENSMRCQSCITGYHFYLSNYSCLPTCPPFYYSSSGVCYSCQTPCLSCISATRCLSCKGLFLFNGTCVSSCPMTSFGDTQTMQCLQCDSQKCASCFGASTYCTSCKPTLILLNRNCLASCPNSYYLQQINYICLRCKDNCQICLNQTYCITCQSIYILQNGNCIRNCDAGYYKITVNKSEVCLSCSFNCSSCQTINNTISCLTCIGGYNLLNGQCQSLCGIQHFAYNGLCYSCISPCNTCSSQKMCQSCRPSFGYLFNSSCLNSCPIGYYQSNSNYMCVSCSLGCLNCIGSSDNCSSCSKGLFLQHNTCTNNCSAGYYSTSSTNICHKCSDVCKTCSRTPTNCTLCSSPSLVPINGLCLQHCSLGLYKINGNCAPCPEQCSTCINSSYCTQCNLEYYLSNYTCKSLCPLNTFALNGFCRNCRYPCKTCVHFQTCLTCEYGYLLAGNCVSTCSPPTFLNNSSLACEECPSNCSNCLNPHNCLQCLQGVLVNGSCLAQCPQGYYNYYSVCAPCMYGCLICSDSSTCTFCYIGYLYSGLCLQYCPAGWVSRSNGGDPACQKCISGCLKCSVEASQCTLCGNGLFLYLYKCLSNCPIGTYKNYGLNTCDTCKSPCQACQNGYSCSACIYGYILYAQPSGNQCILGPSCPNSFYLNIIENTCVYQCPNGTYVDPYRYTCNKPCSETYVLLKNNLTCLQSCPTGMWINSNFVCQSTQPSVILPYFSCKGLILRNILIVDCSFSLPIDNLNIMRSENIQITHTTVEQVIIISPKKLRIVTNTPVGVFREAYFAISFTNRYQLHSTVNSQASNSLQDHQRRLTQNFAMPLQNIGTQFYLEEYFSYSDQQRNTGMQLMQIAQSICIGGFIFWLFALLKNLKSTSLTFICIMQWIYSISLVDTTFAPNLGLFLQGFKVSNFFFVYSPANSSPLWLLQNEFRENIWGIVNLFDLKNVFLPTLVIASVFAFIFLCTLALHRRYYLVPQTKEQKSNQQGEVKRQDQQQQQKQEPSIFSDKVSSKGNSNIKMSKDIFESRNQSNLANNKQDDKEQKERKAVIKSQQKSSQKEQRKVEKEQQNNQEAKQKFGLKCQIIHQRFYYNYWLQCILLTASPLSIGVSCQLISSTPLNLIASSLVVCLSIFILITFLRRKFKDEKLFVTTKYWFVVYLQTLIQNGMAILSTAQIYIGVMMLMFTINIYVWNKIFSSKRSNELKLFYQINDAIRIVLLLEALVGYANKKNWNSDTYYYYSWIFIATLIVLIVFAAIQNNKQFFDHQQGLRKSLTKILEQNEANNSESDSSIVRSKMAEGEQADDKEEESQIRFFSKHDEEETDSDNDIIDFDEVEDGQRQAPMELIRYQKQKNL